MSKLTLKRKRIIAVISLIILIGIMVFLSYFIGYKFFNGTVRDFEGFIESYGWYGRFVGFLIQFLQVFIALIPGEFVEVGLGFAFGAIEGTVICMAGLFFASVSVFVLVKKWGIKAAELFFDIEKINSLRFINSEKKLRRMIFILFLIPGTPKDLLTYVVPLTKIPLTEFLTISMLARIPSVVSSTIGGNFFEDGKYIEGVLLFLITGAISLIGLKVYDIIKKKRAEKSTD